MRRVLRFSVPVLRTDSFCALRTLGEVYSVLTGSRTAALPAVTVGHFKQIREKLTIISLTETE